LYLGEHTIASIVPQVVYTTETVISQFSPTTRGCYIDEEFHLKYLNWTEGYRYSMKNCMYAAVLEKVFSNCSCIPDYYGSANNLLANLPPCRYILQWIPLNGIN
jgi:hypothetical protein